MDDIGRVLFLVFLASDSSDVQRTRDSDDSSRHTFVRNLWCVSCFICYCGLGIIGFWLMDGVRVNAGYCLSWFVCVWILSYVAPALVGVAGVPAVVPLAYHEVCSVCIHLVVLARRLR